MNLRQQVKERDRYRCLVCSSTKNLTVDHILPRSMGGASSLENFQTMCQPCNCAKGATIVDFINMTQVQKRLWLLNTFGEEWREILYEKNGRDAYE